MDLRLFISFSQEYIMSVGERVTGLRTLFQSVINSDNVLMKKIYFQIFSSLKYALKSSPKSRYILYSCENGKMDLLFILTFMLSIPRCWDKLYHANRDRLSDGMGVCSHSDLIFNVPHLNHSFPSVLDSGISFT